MADVGDLVLYQERYWRILKRDGGLRTFTLQAWDESTVEVEDDSSDIVFHATPTKWPYVMAPPMGAYAKRFEKLTRFVRVKAIELGPYKDWTPVDILRPGGAIFVNPKLKLLPGEVLVVHYANGSQSRVLVNKNMGSIAKRKKRNEIPTPKNLWDHLDE